MRSYPAVLVAAASASALILLSPSPAAAQNENALRRSFEGKTVILRIDMPGSSDGVDIRVGRDGEMDSVAYGVRLKRYGTAFRAGDRAVVTLVKIKNDHIEFQLGGGGFGTFGDDTSTSVTLPYVEKSRREIELEKRVHDEEDRRVRRDLQHELDELREERERANRRIDAERAHLEELKRERIAADRRHGGSRFNLFYVGSVPPEIRPDDVMAALGGYVDFSLAQGIASPQAPAPADTSMLWKGMPREDVERALGRPLQSSERHDAGFAMATLVFPAGDGRLIAEFVEDVLVRYTIASR